MFVIHPPKYDKTSNGQGSMSLYESKLTLVHPFFGESERFKLLIKTWMGYSKKIKECLDIIIVDDHGSHSVSSMLVPSITKRIDFNLTVYEIEDDLRYNTPGALNLGIITALTPWVLIMDSDCTFLPEDMAKVMGYFPRKDISYRFDRLRVTEDKKLLLNMRFLPCTMLTHKDIFFDVGGFDEDFTGEYSGGYGFFDNHFDHKILHSKITAWRRIPENIVATEWMTDVVGDNVDRTEDEEKINRKLMYGKCDGTIPESHHMLRFSWKKVYGNRL